MVSAELILGFQSIHIFIFFILLVYLPMAVLLFFVYIYYLRCDCFMVRVKRNDDVFCIWFVWCEKGTIMRSLCGKRSGFLCPLGKQSNPAPPVTWRAPIQRDVCVTRYWVLYPTMHCQRGWLEWHPLQVTGRALTLGHLGEAMEHPFFASGRLTATFIRGNETTK